MLDVETIVLVRGDAGLTPFSRLRYESPSRTAPLSTGRPGQTRQGAAGWWLIPPLGGDWHVVAGDDGRPAVGCRSGLRERLRERGFKRRAKTFSQKERVVGGIVTQRLLRVGDGALTDGLVVAGEVAWLC